MITYDEYDDDNDDIWTVVKSRQIAYLLTDSNHVTWLRL